MLVHLTVYVDAGLLRSVPQAWVVSNSELSLHDLDSILF